jgi:ABC-type Zn2+ transport system substrate-binding protein/surface adhesin
MAKKEEEKKEEGKEEGKEEEKKDDKKGDDGGTVEMRAGDYNIHVYLEKMKELNVAEGDTMDPMI